MVTTTVSSAMVSVGTTMMALASFSRISLKEHYARCIHNEHNYFDFVSAGEGNTEFGQINGVMYKFPVKRCWLQN